MILGDGECDEGQVWEAAAAVAHFGLNRVTVIVDDNGLQFDGRKEDILKAGDAAGRWASYGYSVTTVDGHDVEASLPQVALVGGEAHQGAHRLPAL